MSDCRACHIVRGVYLLDEKLTSCLCCGQNALCGALRHASRVDVFVDADYAEILSLRHRRGSASVRHITGAIRRLALDEREIVTAMNVFRDMRRATERKKTRDVDCLGARYHVHRIDLSYEPFVHLMRNKIKLEGDALSVESAAYVGNVVRDTRRFASLFDVFFGRADVARALNARFCAHISPRKARAARDTSGDVRHAVARALSALPPRASQILKTRARRDIRTLADRFQSARTRSAADSVATWNAAFSVLERTYLTARVIYHASTPNATPCVVVAGPDVLSFVRDALCDMFPDRDHPSQIKTPTTTTGGHAVAR
jgi:hypothetical protein